MGFNVLSTALGDLRASHSTYILVDKGTESVLFYILFQSLVIYVNIVKIYFTILYIYVLFFAVDMQISMSIHIDSKDSVLLFLTRDTDSPRPDAARYNGQ